jgi:SAM-dependent MidA family methyltransferase
VNQEDGSFVVRWRQAPPEVARLAAQWLPIPVGAIGEVCPDYADFFRAVGQLGPPLKALFFDYGITQEEWAAGLRPEGTVRAYARHMLVDALAAPGAQDITADVHWDHVCASARAAGLHVRGLTPQGSFLIQHGILEAFEQWQQAAQGEAARLRTVPMAGQLKQLIFPGGMGERFQVLECERAE